MGTAQATATATTSGIGLGGLTFLALLILELGGWAQISWFWVFFPLWISTAVILGIVLLCLLGVGIFVSLVYLWCRIFGR